MSLEKYFLIYSEVSLVTLITLVYIITILKKIVIFFFIYELLFN